MGELKLDDLIRPIKDWDKNQPGYNHAQGWNDAIRYCMDLQVASPAPSRNEVLEEADKQTLLDPDAVHLNMLRGTIAKPTLAQIIHIYGADTVERALKTSGNDE